LSRSEVDGQATLLEVTSIEETLMLGRSREEKVSAVQDLVLAVAAATPSWATARQYAKLEIILGT
jgi:hypothetical protein